MSLGLQLRKKQGPNKRNIWPLVLFQASIYYEYFYILVIYLRERSIRKRSARTNMGMMSLSISGNAS